MTAKAVQFVLVVRYNLTAHKAVYGRLHGPPKTYSKDFLQLPRTRKFLDAIDALFGLEPHQRHSIPIVYRWPNDCSAKGAFVYRSADRPHLSWGTSVGAPVPWKMTPRPTSRTPQTIPGDPSHEDPLLADAEFDRLGERGAGQPYLVAVKLVDEENIFHLRAYLKEASPSYEWADFALLPEVVREAAPAAGARAATGWVVVPSGTLFFDPNAGHDAWRTPDQLRGDLRGSSGVMPEDSDHFPLEMAGDDARAETLPADEHQIQTFDIQIRNGEYTVPDVSSTVKTRGSAQRAFSQAVRDNYAGACAITGISSRPFLVASHIVPWSEDETIRLDPSNGICLSLLVDKAFELGCLQIDDDFLIRIDWHRLADDLVLREALRPYDGVKLRLPQKYPPNLDYLRRRRELVKARHGGDDHGVL